MSQRMTRRHLTAALGSAAAIAAVRAQAPSTSQPEDLNASAQEQIRKYRQVLAKVDLPVSTEPAFLFKA